MAYKSSPRGTRPVSLVVVHTAEGARTAASLGAYFWRDDVQASSHVGIDAGATLQYVGYDRAAWTVRSGNPISDNAELCGFARWTRAQWLGTTSVDGCANPRATLDRTAAWIRSRCLARGIPIRKLTAADVAAGRSGVIGHVEWTIGMRDGTHTDPGSSFPWDYVIGKAQQAPEQDWLSMATKDEVREAVEEGVFRALSRFVASDEERWQGRNWADNVTQQTLSGLYANDRLDEINAKLGQLVESSAPDVAP